MHKFENLLDNKIIAFLSSINYFIAPSSFKKHGNWIGGNFDHSVAVLNNLLKFTKEKN